MLNYLWLFRAKTISPSLFKTFALLLVIMQSSRRVLCVTGFRRSVSAAPVSSGERSLRSGEAALAERPQQLRCKKVLTRNPGHNPPAPLPTTLKTLPGVDFAWPVLRKLTSKNTFSPPRFKGREVSAPSRTGSNDPNRQRAAPGPTRSYTVPARRPRRSPRTHVSPVRAAGTRPHSVPG